MQAGLEGAGTVNGLVTGLVNGLVKGLVPEEGLPWPLGAHIRDGGVNIAIVAPGARQLQWCLFDEQGHETARLDLHGPHDGVFHGFLPGAGAGLIYGLRAHGPYEPAQGHRFNPHKLLLDPWARDIVGRFEWRDEHFGHVAGHPDGLRVMDLRDNAAWALKARVTAAADDATAARLRSRRPLYADCDVLLYEVHVKGFSQQLPGVPEPLRGTYAGLAHPACVAHFKRLGISSLQLLPVQHALTEQHLALQGKVNYWGYNTLGFFCVDPRWSCTPGDAGRATDEFRQMVIDLHAAGLEVLLDVVFNHSAEGGDDGPTLTFRGLDHGLWYRSEPGHPGRCENLSGCGNTLAVWQPRVTQFVLDALRHWVLEMGVDGFRFDLATVLARNRDGHFDPEGTFLGALRQDPVLGRVRLIAESWDCAAGGYQVGRFPGRFHEWNDQYRDAVRSYWLKDAAGLNHRAPRHSVGRGEMARRLAGSSDLFHHSQRRPCASVNFITAHDGHTLADVVSYTRKHNLANGENNRDGRDNEISANFGIEGATENQGVMQTRSRVQRAMLATLLFSQGMPMLCAGDEIGRTQRGNNNAYCLDGSINWLDWEHADGQLCDYTAQLVALRRKHPLLRHDDWFSPAHPQQLGAPQLRWLGPEGQPLQAQHWHGQDDRGFACEFCGPGSPRLLLVFNPHEQAAQQRLQGRWQLEIDSSGSLQGGLEVSTPTISVPAQSVLLLVECAPS